ncbi:MAG: c-type cytochrome [Burkholderiales bacterium]
MIRSCNRPSTLWPGRLAALAGLLAVAVPIPHAVAADTAGRDLAASCAACHGTNGRASGEIPSLAGVDRETILDRLGAFRTGARSATVMHQHAKGYTEAELGLIADHFAAQPRKAR